MGIFTKAILGLIDTGLSIVEFLIIVRLLLMWRQIRWLIPFDTAGKDLVNSFAGIINRGWKQWRNCGLSLRGQLIVGLIALIVLRNLLPVIAVLL